MCRFISMGLEGLAGAVVFLPDCRSTPGSGMVALHRGRACIIVLLFSKIAGFRGCDCPLPNLPASQGREQFPGNVLDYEEGWTTRRLDNERVSKRGVDTRG